MKITQNTFFEMAKKLTNGEVVTITRRDSEGQIGSCIDCARWDNDVLCTDGSTIAYKVDINDWMDPANHVSVHYTNLDFIRGLPMEDFTLVVDYPYELTVNDKLDPTDVVNAYDDVIGDD
jgi:hypothetical protein